MEVSPRLTRWIMGNFPPGTNERVLHVLSDLPDSAAGGQDPERIMAAMVLGASGSWDSFIQLVDLAERDWRDLLMGADLAHQDWPERLDQMLGGPGAGERIARWWRMRRS